MKCQSNGEDGYQNTGGSPYLIGCTDGQSIHNRNGQIAGKDAETHKIQRKMVRLSIRIWAVMTIAVIG